MVCFFSTDQSTAIWIASGCPARDRAWIGSNQARSSSDMSEARMKRQGPRVFRGVAA